MKTYLIPILVLTALVCCTKLFSQDNTQYAKPTKIINFEGDKALLDQLRISVGFGYYRRLDNKYMGDSNEAKSFVNELRNGNRHVFLKYFPS